MEPRNWVGIAFIVAGVVLQPVGWLFVFWVQVLSFVLIFVGAVIFLTQKYIQKSEEKEFGSRSRSGRAMPGDVHEHSGWGSGGRSESWSSDVGDGGSGGGE